MKPTISSMTVSVEYKDTEYGKGSVAFGNLTAKYPGEGLPLEDLDSAIDDSLVMYLGLWKSIISQRFAARIISGKDLKENLANLESRIDTVRAFLKKQVGEQ